MNDTTLSPTQQRGLDFDFDLDSLIYVVGMRYSGRSRLSLSICKRIKKERWIVICAWDARAVFWREAGLDTRVISCQRQENIEAFSDLASSTNHGFIFDRVMMGRITGIPVLYDLFHSLKERNNAIIFSSTGIPEEVIMNYDYLCLLACARKPWRRLSLSFYPRFAQCSSFSCPASQPAGQDNSLSVIRRVAEFVKKADVHFSDRPGYPVCPAIVLHFKAMNVYWAPIVSEDRAKLSFSPFTSVASSIYGRCKETQKK